MLSTVPLSGVNAQENEESTQKSIESIYFTNMDIINGEIIYNYKYNGITLNSNVILTDVTVENKVEEVENLSSSKVENSNRITPYVNIPTDPYPGSIVAGPYYKTYKNTAVQEASNLLVAWVATKVPGFISKSTFGNYVFNKLTGFVTGIKTTHVGAWQSKAYNSSISLYEYFNTIVHYEDSQYKTPKTVSYYVVYRDKN